MLILAGCGVDVPSHFYSWSWSLNPNWTKQFVNQPEILECIIYSHLIPLHPYSSQSPNHLVALILCPSTPDFAELRIDMKEEVRRWGIEEQIHFNVECLAAEWSDLTSLWTVKFINLVTGEEFERRCQVLISCIGEFNDAKPFKIPGLFHCTPS